MSETFKTGIYVMVAAIALLVGWWSRPAAISYEKVDDSGQRFFEQFDPLAAKSLEIVSVNPDTLARRTFKVAQQDGRWVIPSHENYPADAQDHLAQAATSVMDVTKGPMVSDSAADHELFGVADPTTGNSPSAGAGTLVTLQDGSGKTLVDLILGKAVKDAPNLRYVRVPGRDRVYSAAVKTDALSTKFEDWIERDLLQVDGPSISEIIVDDYSIDELNQRINRGERLNIKFDQANNKWTMEGLKEGETLATAKLDEMRTALDNLQIVDVHRKPAGLSAQLQTEGAMKIDAAAIASLQDAGYYIVSNQLLSNEGETIIHTNDGIVYELRFGEVINFDTGSEGKDVASGTSSTEPGRYVFVTAHFDQSLLPQPQYDPVPEPAASQPATSQPAATQPGAATQPQEDAARNAVIESNKRKKDEFDQKVAAGQEKAKKLNARFADWYYVVSDKVYQQIRHRRSDLVTTGTPSASSAATPNSLPPAIAPPEPAAPTPSNP